MWPVVYPSLTYSWMRLVRFPVGPCHKAARLTWAAFFLGRKREGRVAPFSVRTVVL